MNLHHFSQNAVHSFETIGFVSIRAQTTRIMCGFIHSGMVFRVWNTVEKISVFNLKFRKSAIEKWVLRTVHMYYNVIMNVKKVELIMYTRSRLFCQRDPLWCPLTIFSFNYPDIKMLNTHIIFQLLWISFHVQKAFSTIETNYANFDATIWI